MKKTIALLASFMFLIALAALNIDDVQADTNFTVTVSSTLADDRYECANLTDGDVSTMWYSQWADEKNPDCNEWILLDFGSVRKVESISLTPNADRICFPSDFSIGWGITGDVWPEIEGFHFTDYRLGDASTETFLINTVTRYVRISISKRNKNPDGNYLVSVAEITAIVRNATAVEVENAEKADAAIERIPVVNDPVIPSVATASSSNTPEKDWGVQNINDGQVSTQWCAEWGSGVNQESCDEWIILTFSTPQYVKGMSIQSQLAEHYGFPKSFSMEWSLDGETFFAVEGASYTDESTADTLHIKVFDTPVTATAIRMSITGSYPDTTGNYLPQLAELQAHGRSATEEEITAATELFNRLKGQSPDIAPVKTDYLKKYGTKGAVLLALAVVFLGGAACIALCGASGKKKGRNEDEK